MATYSARRVKKALRELGLKELPRGKGGHSIFVTGKGRRVCPPLRKKEMPFAHVFTLAVALEGLGIVASTRAFIARIKNEVSEEQSSILAPNAI